MAPYAIIHHTYFFIGMYTWRMYSILSDIWATTGAILFSRKHFFACPLLYLQQHVQLENSSLKKYVLWHLSWATNLELSFRRKRAFLSDFLRKTYIGLLDITNTQINSPFNNARKQGVRFPYKWVPEFLLDRFLWHKSWSFLIENT